MGASPFHYNQDGETAIDHAKKRHAGEIISLLEKYPEEKPSSVSIIGITYECDGI